MLKAIIDILFPRLCIGCNRGLLKNEHHLCTPCLHHLPFSDHVAQRDNLLEKTFWGRVELTSASSLLEFKKGNVTQRLLHELKYKDNKEVGVFLGSLYGLKLKQGNIMPEAIVAVPLHKTKFRKRGYNQSDLFAEGIGYQLQVPNYSKFIYRVKETETQTRKSRFERWENVEEIFTLTNPELFSGKHVLIVDDVITTGATMEACARAFSEAKNCTVSVGSIAFATV